jgi:hypothetical protein
VWKTGAARRFVRYAHQFLSTALPTNASCFGVEPDLPHHHSLREHRHAGASGHIHPLWAVPRPLGGVDDGTGTGTLISRTRALSVTTGWMPQTRPLRRIIELTDEVSDEDALQLRAFRHLLFARPELELVMGAVVAARAGAECRRQSGVDDNGQPCSGCDADRADGRGQRTQIAVFTVMNNPTHAGMLSTAELRLLSGGYWSPVLQRPVPPTPQN